MPYKETKAPGGGVRVVNAKTGKVHAKDSTPENAAKQERLLNAIDHGFKPTGVHAKLKKKLEGGADSEEGEPVADDESAEMKKRPR